MRGTSEPRHSRRRVTYGSGKAAPSDRELVRLHPEIFFARQAPVSARVHVDACPLEDRGYPHPRAVQGGVEAVDQDLVLVELHLAELARTARPDLGGELELRAGAGRRAGLDRQPR